MMDRPLPTSNPTLKTLYDDECTRLLADLSDNASCAEQTLQALDQLPGQYPQLEQMAAMLNISARTYRRRLAAESTSFQALRLMKADSSTRSNSFLKARRCRVRPCLWGLTTRPTFAARSANGAGNHPHNGNGNTPRAVHSWASIWLKPLLPKIRHVGSARRLETGSRFSPNDDPLVTHGEQRT